MPGAALSQGGRMTPASSVGHFGPSIGSSKLICDYRLYTFWRYRMSPFTGRLGARGGTRSLRAQNPLHHASWCTQVKTRHKGMTTFHFRLTKEVFTTRGLFCSAGKRREAPVVANKDFDMQTCVLFCHISTRSRARQARILTPRRACFSAGQ